MEEQEKKENGANAPWENIKPSEIDKAILKLHEEGNHPAKIGLILRDKHGVPKAKVFGKKISKVLKKAGKSVKTEKEIIKERVEKLEKHLEKHKHDYTAKRARNKKLWMLAK